MRRLALLLLLIVSAPVYADTETEIRAALDFFVQVWNEDDVEAIQGYYHPRFVQIGRNGPVSREEHVRNILTLIHDGGDRGTLAYSDIVVEELGAEHAMAYGHMTLGFEDGSAIDAWFTTVYVKTPFGWKAILTRN